MKCIWKQFVDGMFQVLPLLVMIHFLIFRTKFKLLWSNIGMLMFHGSQEKTPTFKVAYQHHTYIHTYIYIYIFIPVPYQ